MSVWVDLSLLPSFQGHRATPSIRYKGICPVCSGHINLCQINKRRKNGRSSDWKWHSVICLTYLTSSLFFISYKIIAYDLCHGNWVSVARCTLNILLIYDNILRSLLISVQQESTSESEVLVSSGSLQADTGRLSYSCKSNYRCENEAVGV